MELFYRKSGSGAPLVILHGLFGSSDNWQTLAKKFSHEFTVIVPDLRNHGQSPHSDEISYGSMARDLQELYDKLGLQPVCLIGHSMGGKTAMQFAITFPEKVEKLVIVDIAPRSYPVSHDHYVESMAGLELDKYSRRKEIDLALAVRLPNNRIRQFLLKNLRRNDHGHFRWKINLEAIRANLSNLGTEIISEKSFPKPALFITGGQSDYIRRDDPAHIEKLFPNSTVEVFPDSGHWVHADDPAGFYDKVNTFLKSEKSSAE